MKKEEISLEVIKKVLESYDNTFGLSDGGFAVDIDDASAVIYQNLNPKDLNPKKNEENNSDDTETGYCKNYCGGSSIVWNCFIYAGACDGKECKKDCDWYNKRGAFKYRAKK